LRLFYRRRAMTIRTNHCGVVIEAPERGHERIDKAVIHQEFAAAPLEVAEIGVVRVERLLPGFAAPRWFIVRQIYVGIEIDIEVAEAGLSREYAIPEERGRTASWRIGITDQHLTPECFTARDETRPDLLVGSRVRRALIDGLDCLALGSG